ncbi:MAG: hypothetical protein A3D28_04640 [Omnitrophica bacterium RIFCSPHIGHO2_02_FULL_63_14]|nr:MAG: hypothetical protein A3D28_04640 [Omnitrophica bacterium RIFCSPHIGHO2_02_FULL_63_14]
MINLPDTVFVLIAGMMLIAAAGAVWLKNVFYNALCLIACLFGVACLFIYLNAEFLAVMQVIIYIGAIAVAILFVIMLSHPMARRHAERSGATLARSAVLAGALFALLAKAVLSAAWVRGSSGGDSTRAIGRALLGESVLPFEIVSVVLLAAIIGALVISRNR